MAAETSEYLKPLPRPTPFSEPFWEGARQHKLLVQRCGSCGRFRWTPQLACPWCLAEEYEWREASGRATLYSFTVIHRPPDPVAFAGDVPYVLAVVELEEGPFMQTNLVGCPLEAIRIDMPVEVTFERATEEISLYKFRPAR